MVTIHSLAAAAVATAKSHQSCPTLCNPIDGSEPGSSVPGILQARILEWVAISFSNAWKWKVKVRSLSHVQLFATPWTVAHQAPPSTGFSRQDYCSGLPLPSPYSLDILLSHLEPVCCYTSSSNCCFLTCIQVSQETDKVVCYSYPFKNFPVCCDPHSQRL